MNQTDFIKATTDKIVEIGKERNKAVEDRVKIELSKLGYNFPDNEQFYDFRKDRLHIVCSGIHNKLIYLDYNTSKKLLCQYSTEIHIGIDKSVIIFKIW